MGWIRLFLGLGLLVGLGVGGCAWSDHQVRPQPPPEEFKAPPDNDPRYSGPVQYPKETLDADMLQKKANQGGKNGPPGTMGGMGGPGGRMGGPGAGSGF